VEADNFLLAKNVVREDIPGSKSQVISGRYNAGVIAKHLSMDAVSFNKMNPDFDKLIAANGKYELRLPEEKMDIFIVKKLEIAEECIQLLLNPNAAPKI
jgi:membrane-bound lytic murein transglycosylase D